MLDLNPIVDAGSAHGDDASSFLEVASLDLGDLTTLRALPAGAHALDPARCSTSCWTTPGLGFLGIPERGGGYGPNSPYWNWHAAPLLLFEPGVMPLRTRAGLGSRKPAGATGPQRPGRGALPPRGRAPRAHGRVRRPPRGRAERARRRSRLRGVRRGARTRRCDQAPIRSANIRTAHASWLQGDQFDSLMNYALGRDVLLKYAKGASPLFGGRWALAQLSDLTMRYPTAVAAMGFNVIDSHDTGRLLTELGGGDWGATPPPTALARLRLASALLYAMPGMPVTFQGDECAQLGQKVGDFERYPVQWGSCNPGMQAHYARLGNLKAALPALASPLWIAYRGQGSVLAFFRGDPGTGRVLAAFNSGAAPAALELPPGGWTDAVTHTRYRGEVDLPPLGWRYLVLGDAGQCLPARVPGSASGCCARARWPPRAAPTPRVRGCPRRRPPGAAPRCGAPLRALSRRPSGRAHVVCLRRPYATGSVRRPSSVPAPPRYPGRERSSRLAKDSENTGKHHTAHHARTGIVV